MIVKIMIQTALFDITVNLIYILPFIKAPELILCKDWSGYVAYPLATVLRCLLYLRSCFSLPLCQQ